MKPSASAKLRSSTAISRMKALS